MDQLIQRLLSARIAIKSGNLDHVGIDIRVARSVEDFAISQFLQAETFNVNAIGHLQNGRHQLAESSFLTACELYGELGRHDKRLMSAYNVLMCSSEL